MMTEDSDNVEKVISNLLQHIVKHSDEAISRATRILLLGNSGGLVLILNISSFNLEEKDILGPAILFAIGIILSGAGPVFEGILFASIKGIQHNEEVTKNAVKFIANKVRERASRDGPKEADTPKLKEINMEELLPAEELRRGQTTKWWTLTVATIVFCGGVLWGFGIVLQTANY